MSKTMKIKIDRAVMQVLLDELTGARDLAKLAYGQQEKMFALQEENRELLARVTGLEQLDKVQTAFELQETVSQLESKLNERGVEIERLEKLLGPSKLAAGSKAMPGVELEAAVRALIDRRAVHARNGMVMGRETWEDVFRHLSLEENELKDAIVKDDQPEILAELGGVLGLVVRAIIKAGFSMRSVEHRELQKLAERFPEPEEQSK